MLKEEMIRLIVRGQSRLGIGKSALARKSGVSREMLYRFERGKSDFSVDKLIAVAGALGLRVEIVEDIGLLPTDYREQKTLKQMRFLAHHPEEAAHGFCAEIKIGRGSIPDIAGDGW
ncbi:MAG: helix-turn-helix transcriptional regulator [Propionivibrio sp.]|nr:helix-turn-helix transcriptional regulator [Propionivibrio sp.]